MITRTFVLGALTLLGGCAELQRLHEEQVARDCLPAFSQQKGQRDGAYGQPADVSWFKAYCPPHQQAAAVQAYSAGYNAGRPQIQPPLTRPPVQPQVQPPLQTQTQPPVIRPRVQPPVVIVVPGSAQVPGPAIVVPEKVRPEQPQVVPDYEDLAWQELPVVVPDHSEQAGQELPVVVPDHQEQDGQVVPEPLPDHGNWVQQEPQVMQELPQVQPPMLEPGAGHYGAEQPWEGMAEDS